MLTGHIGMHNNDRWFKAWYMNYGSICAQTNNKQKEQSM